MKYPGAVIGGVVAAVVGAVVWTLVAHLLNLEIGILAWGIGGLVGFGVMLGGGSSASPAKGAIAVVLAALSILGGKWAAVELDYRSVMSASDELMISYVADDVVSARIQAGERLAMPEVPADEVADDEEDYPEDVWTEAVAIWDTIPGEDREAMREAHLADVQQAVGSKTDLFTSNFGLLDLVFFGLAIFTAFKLGSAGDEDGDGGGPVVADGAADGGVDRRDEMVDARRDDAVPPPAV